jgi:shikimate dehydrogenase
MMENISDCEFIYFPVKDLTRQSLEAILFEYRNLKGLSVTIPHKEKIITLLDAVDRTALEVGAVNCIRIEKGIARHGGIDVEYPEHRYTTGYNTDVNGFEKSMAEILKQHYTKAFILGTGGAAKAVAYVLGKMKKEFSFVSRTSNLRYSDLNQKMISENTLIINTTPLGMFPAIEECPDIPYEYLTDRHLLYDLIYNPEETLFLKKGKEKGAQTKNGLEMLHLQAEKAWEIWNS